VATYDIKSPTGETFEVNAPDTATEAEVMAYAQSQFAAKPQPQVETQPQIPTSIPVSAELPPPEQVKLPSGEEALKQQSERFNQAFMSGLLGIAPQIVQAQTQFERQIPVVQELERAGIKQPTLGEQLTSALPEPLSKAVAFEPQTASEMGVQIGAGFFSPESVVLTPKKAAPTAPITPEDFEPIAAWKSTTRNIEDQSLTPLLKQELQTAVEEQAKYETRLATQEAKISKQTGEIISKEMGAKEKAAQRIDKLAQDAAIATANKEQALATAVTPEEIKAATIQESKIHGQLGKKAQQIGEDLQIERYNLLKELEQKSKLRLDLTEVSDKLQENLIKQEQLKQTIKDAPVQVFENVDWTRSFGSINTPERVAEVALERTRLVDDLVKAGIVSKDNAPSLKKAVFDEVLSANGIKPVSKELTDWNLLTESFRWGKVQRRSGIPVGEAQQKVIWAKNEAQNVQTKFKDAAAGPIKNLRRSGISHDDQLVLLQYFETMPDGTVRFNPTAFQYVDPASGVMKVNIPNYAGPALSPQQIQDFSNLRMLLDQAADTFKVPKLPRYVPIRELPQFISIPTKTTAEAIRNPALAQARTTGSLVRGVHDTNIVNVLDRYAREGVRKTLIAPTLENAVDALSMLHMGGLKSEADKFGEYLIKAFNLKDKRDAADILGAFKYDTIKDEVANFVKRFDDPESAAKQIAQSLTEAMYVKFLGTNLRSITKQYLQFPTMGMIELGPRWVASAAKDIFNKARKLDAERIIKASLVKDSAFFEKEALTAPSNKIAKLIDMANAPYKFTSKFGMETGERVNRLSSVIAAQNKFDYYWSKGGVSGIDSLLKESALTTSQRSLVSKAYMTGGVQNAKDAYALIITQRMNFAYGAADAPKVFRDYGKLFPFLTYTRNILSRGAEALDEKKYGYFPKLILEPLVGLAIFSALTKELTGKGKTLPPGSMPIEAVMDIYEHGISTTPEIIGKNIYKILSPVPYTVWDEKKLQKEIDRQITVFPEIGKSSPLYNKLLKGFK
jgi:hypothetical protein